MTCAGCCGGPRGARPRRRRRSSTAARCNRAGYDGHKQRTGATGPLVVDSLGHLLALLVTPANVQEGVPVAKLAAAVQAATGQAVEVAFVAQGYTGEQPTKAAATAGS